MTKHNPHDAALADAAKVAERLYRENPELFAAQVNELQRLGVEEEAMPFALGFCAGTALMINTLEQAKAEAARRDMFTVLEGGKG